MYSLPDFSWSEAIQSDGIENSEAQLMFVDPSFIAKALIKTTYNGWN